MKADIQAIFAEANAKVPKPKNEYMGEDGFMHCAECHEAVQCSVTVFGKKIVMRCICGCIKKQNEIYEKQKRQDEIERNRRSCFEGSDMINWTFQNDDRKNQKLSNAMCKYAEMFPEFLKEGKGLLLYGQNGTGKSYFSACVANAVIDQGRTALFTNFARIANILQGMYEGKQEYIDGLSHYDLLILDDLGAERQSEYMQEQVFNIVNARVCSGLPMIVTTNLTLAEIGNPADFGRARIYSRVLGACMPIEISGSDRRKENCKKEYNGMLSKLGL